MKTYRVDGSLLKRLREQLSRGATQKEFAFAVGISERRLRTIENNNAIIKRDLLDRLARHLSVNVKEIAYAIDGPRLVASSTVDDGWLNRAFPAEDWLRPRYDTESAQATMNADELFDHARHSHSVACTIETKLSSELSSYASELVELLGSVSYARRSKLDEVHEDTERAIKRRIRELFVLLKGNDVWVYETWVMRNVPESDELPPAGCESKMEMQTVLAFGPPGEYGETSLSIMVDYGQPRMIEGWGKLKVRTQSE